MARDRRPTSAADLSALAAAAFDRGAGVGERDRLIAKLMGPLWGFAWALARPNRDLAEELRAHVLLRCEQGCYDPALGAFPSWVRTVMSRHLITLVRSRGRAAGGGDLPEPTSAGPVDGAGDDSLTAPFSREDLDRIRRWGTPLKRVLLLAQGLVWRKYPPGLWAADVAALGLSGPFPCPGFEDLSRAERNAYLAGVLGVPRNTIHVRMKRWERHLRELKFARDLAAGARDGEGRAADERG